MSTQAFIYASVEAIEIEQILGNLTRAIELSVESEIAIWNLNEGVKSIDEVLSNASWELQWHFERSQRQEA